jgi:hypothetical protein
MLKRIPVFGKIVSIAVYLSYLLLVIVVFDVLILNKSFGLGYPRHYEEENIQRYPAPYVAFTGKPSVADHNELGFRGPSFIKSEPSDLRIAFFGGSTGYNGKPPIAKIIENKLKDLLNKSVFVANYSVVSSNHRQHLHGMIEFLTQFKPDIVIFYGGYNETIQSAYYDPRPGYPYNYFYRSETSPFFKLLLENSAIIGEVDKRIGVFTGINALRKKQKPLTDDWNKRIANKYLETLMIANNIAGTLESKHFGETRFLAFYQPYQVPDKFIFTHNDIKKRINFMKNTFDVSSEYDALGKTIYRDIVHVNQQAKELMGAKIAGIVFNEVMSLR